MGPGGGAGRGNPGKWGAVETKRRQAGESTPIHSIRGLELYRSHKALEGIDAVLPAQDNDPRNRCEPLGVPRSNHYNIRLTQFFQDEYKVVMLYHYDNRWRVIWTDGRELPKVVEAGVEIAGEVREPRFFGYSVGRWVDDYTFEVQTVGTMPDDRVWLIRRAGPSAITR